jgi:hypothetical protein
MRLATWNVEWMVNLFDQKGRLLYDDGWSARYNVTRRDQIDAIAIVMSAIDADGIMIIEAPDENRHRHTGSMLEAFAERFGLRTRKAVIGYPNDTQQEIAFLYDPDRLSARHNPIGAPSRPGAATPLGEAAPRFDSMNQVDLDIDGRLDSIRFNKPPLEIAARTRDGRDLRLIGVHMKSKAPRGLSNHDEEARLAIAARREQLAQCLWLRARVLEHLAAKESLIVLGDFNDGPGIDQYEKLFGRSGVEIVLGWDEPRETRLFDPHARAALGRKLAAQPATARFYLDDQKRYFSALLDYVMVSPDLRALGSAWRIWHPFDDAGVYRVPELREALLAASDHFPVSIDLPI